MGECMGSIGFIQGDMPKEEKMKILLAYDGAHHSKAALDEVADLASREGGAEVTVLSVAPPGDAPTRTGSAPSAHEDAEIARDYLRERGVESAAQVETGEPAPTILEAARSGGYDLLVTGTRGRGPVARLLLGSVSHKLAEETPCTLLVVSDDHRLRVEPRSLVKGQAS
jgi:nucleotide-binding universal stress UspA family protein